MADADGWIGRLHVPGLTLVTPNVLLRMHWAKRAGYRQAVYEALWQAVMEAGAAWRPPQPLVRFALTVWMERRHLMDADAKYLAPKVLLDVLQPDRLVVGGSGVPTLVAGLGIIANDTDGEGGLPGALAKYEVRQLPAQADAVRLLIEEWSEDSPSGP